MEMLLQVLEVKLSGTIGIRPTLDPHATTASARPLRSPDLRHP